MPDEANAWRLKCTDIGLDPQEVRAVSSRYDMYKRYTDDMGGNTLPLERWYKWYRVEKLSEGHAMLSPPEQGCSIDIEAGQDTGPVVSESAFLEILQLYRAAK